MFTYPHLRHVFLITKIYGLLQLIKRCLCMGELQAPAAPPAPAAPAAPHFVFLITL